MHQTLNLEGWQYEGNSDSSFFLKSKIAFISVLTLLFESLLIILCRVKCSLEMAHWNPIFEQPFK